MNKKLRDCIENLDWTIYEDAQGGVDLRKYSPAGEDFGFYIDADNFIRNVIEYVYNFDPDEHAEMWIENMHNVKGVPQSIRTLIQDAEDIKDMLFELAEALKEIKE